MLAAHTKLSSKVQVPRSAGAARPSRLSVCRVAAQDGQDRASAPKSQINVGDRLPETQFQVLPEGEKMPQDISSSCLSKGKVVAFGLPGAFTSVCSSKQVPEYKKKAAELKAAGVETIACLSVNDAFVMADWAKHLGVDTKNEVMMLADGEGKFHKAAGLSQFLPGLGDRARRYSMYLEDGVIKVFNLEEPGGMSYKVSGPDHMLNDLKNLASSSSQKSTPAPAASSSSTPSSNDTSLPLSTEAPPTKPAESEVHA